MRVGLHRTQRLDSCSANHSFGSAARTRFGQAEFPVHDIGIHGVQHMFHAPAFLERWPSDDRRSRLVFIARDLPREFAEALLDTIEAEGREAGTA
jgi:hypothetical protein